MKRNRRVSKFLKEEDTDPLSVVVNLFDVAMVFAVALMVAMVMHMNMTEVFGQEDFTIVKNPGKENMEIISIPLKGKLKHGDNHQNSRIIIPGDIQTMSAGTGIYHSEMNGSDTEAVEFLQIWVIPNVEETKPEYHNYNIRPLLKRNELATFISPSGNTPAHLLQDTWFSIGTFDAGHSVIYRMHKPRTGVYIFVIEGESNVAGENLSRRDGIGIWDIESVTIEATSETQILAIEVAM